MGQCRAQARFWVGRGEELRSSGERCAFSSLRFSVDRGPRRRFEVRASLRRTEFVPPQSELRSDSSPFLGADIGPHDFRPPTPPNSQTIQGADIGPHDFRPPTPPNSQTIQGADIGPHDFGPPASPNSQTIQGADLVRTISGLRLRQTAPPSWEQKGG